MKKYIKPSIEVIELRPEESLANCGSKVHGLGGGRGNTCTNPNTNEESLIDF